MSTCDVYKIILGLLAYNQETTAIGWCHCSLHGLEVRRVDASRYH